MRNEDSGKTALVHRYSQRLQELRKRQKDALEAFRRALNDRKVKKVRSTLDDLYA